MHLGQLELGFGADSGREGCVSDHVAEGLSVNPISAAILSPFSCSILRRSLVFVFYLAVLARKEFCIPLCLVGLKDLSLGVVAQGADIDETAQIELLGAEHRHFEGRWRGLSMMKLAE